MSSDLYWYSASWEQPHNFKPDLKRARASAMRRERAKYLPPAGNMKRRLYAAGIADRRYERQERAEDLERKLAAKVRDLDRSRSRSAHRPHTADAASHRFATDRIRRHDDFEGNAYFHDGDSPRRGMRSSRNATSHRGAADTTTQRQTRVPDAHNRTGVRDPLFTRSAVSSTRPKDGNSPVKKSLRDYLDYEPHTRSGTTASGAAVGESMRGRGHDDSNDPLLLARERRLLHSGIVNDVYEMRSEGLSPTIVRRTRRDLDAHGLVDMRRDLVGTDHGVFYRSKARDHDVDGVDAADEFHDDRRAEFTGLAPTGKHSRPTIWGLKSTRHPTREALQDADRRDAEARLRSTDGRSTKLAADKRQEADRDSRVSRPQPARISTAIGKGKVGIASDSWSAGDVSNPPSAQPSSPPSPRANSSREQGRKAASECAPATRDAHTASSSAAPRVDQARGGRSAVQPTTTLTNAAPSATGVPPVTPGGPTAALSVAAPADTKPLAVPAVPSAPDPGASQPPRSPTAERAKTPGAASPGHKTGPRKVRSQVRRRIQLVSNLSLLAEAAKLLASNSREHREGTTTRSQHRRQAHPEKSSGRRWRWESGVYGTACDSSDESASRTPSTRSEASDNSSASSDSYRSPIHGREGRSASALGAGLPPRPNFRERLRQAQGRGKHSSGRRGDDDAARHGGSAHVEPYPLHPSQPQPNVPPGWIAPLPLSHALANHGRYASSRDSSPVRSGNELRSTRGTAWSAASTLVREPYTPPYLAPHPQAVQPLLVVPPPPPHPYFHPNVPSGVGISSAPAGSYTPHFAPVQFSNSSAYPSAYSPVELMHSMHAAQVHNNSLRVPQQLLHAGQDAIPWSPQSPTDGGQPTEALLSPNRSKQRRNPPRRPPSESDEDFPVHRPTTAPPSGRYRGRGGDAANNEDAYADDRISNSAQRKGSPKRKTDEVVDMRATYTRADGSLRRSIRQSPTREGNGEHSSSVHRGERNIRIARRFAANSSGATSEDEHIPLQFDSTPPCEEALPYRPSRGNRYEHRDVEPL
jgi:hypothetical protein